MRLIVEKMNDIISYQVMVRLVLMGGNILKLDKNVF